MEQKTPLLDLEDIEKFNFSAKVGEVIGGKLARGKGGRFVNIEQLKIQLANRLLERMLEANRRKREKAEQRRREREARRVARSQARRSKKGAAAKERAKKQQQNREKTFKRVAAQTGIDIGELQALAAFRDGQDIDQATLISLAQKGLVEFDQFGQPRMSVSGAGLIRAANRGDSRLALDRLSKARERVAAKREKIADKQERAQELLDEITALEAQLAVSEITGPPEQTIRLKEKIERNRARAEQLLKEAERLLLSLNGPSEVIAKQEPPAEIEDQITGYEDDLTGLIEAAHNGEISESEFSQQVRDLAGVVLLALFLRGSQISEIELTLEERNRLQQEIDLANSSAVTLAADVFGGKFQGEDANSIAARVGLWAAAGIGVYALGQIHRRDDPLLRWQLGAAEHSPNCLELDGQVRRASEWLAAGLYPKSGLLDCSLGCQCSLVEEG